MATEDIFQTTAIVCKTIKTLGTLQRVMVSASRIVANTVDPLYCGHIGIAQCPTPRCSHFRNSFVTVGMSYTLIKEV